MSDSLQNSAPPVNGAAPESPADSLWAQLWDIIVQQGLEQHFLRWSTHLAALFLLPLIAWGMSRLPTRTDTTASQQAAIQTPTPTPLPPALPPLHQNDGQAAASVPRRLLLHTIVPSRPRVEVITYTVQPGDTLFGIAERFALHPETILWANYDILADDPHRLLPGQTLNILPVDGTYYQWHAGDGLNGVAQFFGVDPQDIITWPGNGLSAKTLGDPSNPDIAPGTWLVIPNGTRAFVSWSAPIIPRSDPAVAKVLGAGACGAITEGPVGSTAFVWPADHHYLSGYDYTPQANHYGIDIDGETGDPIYAVDSGVVVYAGWNDWGYGNMVVIDHGNGWQSLYAHLSVLNVQCGSYVFSGDVIAAMGSTGNSTGSHLHFELMHTQYGKVNPWDFLPAP
ncbi:MAG: hypothetical protein Fur0018_05260 [Anaerolineales bacterium]